jgi:proline racemase
MRLVRTIDAHVAGAPLRLVVEGFPALPGPTMKARLEAARARGDALRRMLMLEPRGHADLSGAVLTEPESAAADAGVVFMHALDFGALCGHGIIAVVTVAIERGLIVLPPERRQVVLDTAAGRIRAQYELRQDDRPRVTSVRYVNPPAFLLAAGLRVPLERRQVAVDVACCGEFYAILDAESAGLPLDAAHAPELRRLGPIIARAVEKALKVVHPERADIAGVVGTVFTGPQSLSADLRSTTVYEDGALDRSPGGTVTGAVMAVLDAMGLLSDEHCFTLESLIGTTLRGRIVGRSLVGGLPAIEPEIEGSAFITGEHTFYLDERDPLREGYVL